MNFTHNITRTGSIKEAEKLILDSNTFQPFFSLCLLIGLVHRKIFLSAYIHAEVRLNHVEFSIFGHFFSAKIITSYGPTCYFSALNLTFCTILTFSLLLGSFHSFHFHDCPIFYQVNAHVNHSLSVAFGFLVFLN